MKKENKFVFFGTDNFAVIVLNELKSAGFIPNYVVTSPDRPAGRGHKINKPPTKTWVEKHNDEEEKKSIIQNDKTLINENVFIKILQPEKLDNEFLKELKKNESFDFFITASYGKIIPSTVLDIPKKGTLNVHPSLLPAFRGASPIESAVLADKKETGVTIMLVDEKMDHGPILSQQLVNYSEWPKRIEIENHMAKIGGELLVKTIEPYLSGELMPVKQNHEMATFTEKINKEIGEVDLEKDDPYYIFRKIQALYPWPCAYFFHQNKNKINKLSNNKIRVKITDAKFNKESNELIIEKVIPEGRKEMSWQDFRRGF